MNDTCSPHSASVLAASSANAAFLEHGGRLGLARARYRLAPEPWIDLSTGISPWSYPIPPLHDDCWTRLPDPAHLDDLIEVARAAYQVPDAAQVIAVAGSDLAISLIPRLVPAPAAVAIVGPTYSSHEKAWAACGHHVRIVAHLDAIGAGEIGVVVNPNNPDGRLWSPDQLRQTASRIGGAGGGGAGPGFLVVDEAFCDVAPMHSVLRSDAELAQMIVLRSFGKFYGLAGVRLGFVITGNEIGGPLRGMLSDWPVSGPALAIGRAALGDRAWADRMRNRLNAAAVRLDAILRGGGLDIVGGTDLFRLARHPDATVHFDRLARHGILVRPFKSGGLLRFGLPASDDDLERLRHALAQ